MLAPPFPLWQDPRFRNVPPARCRSSVVEHSLGKGEVDSSILSGSTSKKACAAVTSYYLTVSARPAGTRSEYTHGPSHARTLEAARDRNLLSPRTRAGRRAGASTG